MTDPVDAPPKPGSEWWWEARREYLAVPAGEVRKGDIYANGGTVTKSRKAKAVEITRGSPSVNGVPVPLEDCWHIAVGKGFSITCRRDRAIVVGRRI